MSRLLFTVAHAYPHRPKRVHVAVYRTHRRATLARALQRARQARQAGYLVWVEQTGRIATR